MLDNRLFAEIEPHKEAAVSGGHGHHAYHPAIPCHKDRDPQKYYPAIPCQQPNYYLFNGKKDTFSVAQ